MTTPSRAGSFPRAPLATEVLLLAALLVFLGVVFWQVLAHPSWILDSPYSDILSQHRPFRHLWVDSIRSKGRVPLWNPTVFCGMPLVGDPQSGLFYPPNLGYALTGADHCERFFGWDILIHLVLGGVGMSWWLKGHGFAPLARLAGSVTFVFCGKWFYHLVVPGHVVFLPLAWLSWQCLIVDRIIRRPTIRGGSALGLVTATMLLGCHPQLFFYSQLLLAAYGLAAFLIGRPVQWKSSLRILAAAAMLCLLLSAVQLLPTLELVGYVTRGAGLPYETASGRALTPAQLATFLVPVQNGFGHWEGMAYVGVVASVFALYGAVFGARTEKGSDPLTFNQKQTTYGQNQRGQTPFRIAPPTPSRLTVRSFTLFFAGVVLFCIWYAIGRAGGLHWLLHHWVPGFSLFRIPTRALLILGLPAGYLAAAGWSVLSGPPTRAGRIVAAALAAAAVVAGYCLTGQEARWWAMAGLCLPGILLLPWPSRWRGPLAIAALAALVADEARFALPLVRTRPLADILGHNPLVDRLRAPLGRQRVLDLNFDRPGSFTSLPVTYSSPARIEGLRGFNPFVPRSTFEFLRHGVAQEEATDFYGTVIREFPIASRTHLDLLNVRWLVVNQPLPTLRDRGLVRSTEGLVLRPPVHENVRLYHFSARDGQPSTMHRTYVYENLSACPRAMLVRRARRCPSVEDALRQIAELDPRKEVLLIEPEDSDPSELEYPGPFIEVPVDHRGDEIWIRVDRESVGRGAFLVVAEMWYPGWKATDNGKPVRVERGNGYFQTLRLGPGDHEIRLAYEPTPYRIGKWLTRLGLLLALAGILVRSRMTND